MTNDEPAPVHRTHCLPLVCPQVDLLSDYMTPSPIHRLLIMSDADESPKSHLTSVTQLSSQALILGLISERMLFPVRDAACF